MDIDGASPLSRSAVRIRSRRCETVSQWALRSRICSSNGMEEESSNSRTLECDMNERANETWTSLLLCLGLSFLLGACGSPDDDDEQECEPDTTRVCECAEGGEGEQTCKEDGSGWTSCRDCSSETTDEEDSDDQEEQETSDTDDSDDDSTETEEENEDQCSDLGATCASNSDCCSGICFRGECDTSSCADYGESCTVDSDCCSLECDILCE